MQRRLFLDLIRFKFEFTLDVTLPYVLLFLFSELVLYFLVRGISSLARLLFRDFR